MGLEGTRQGEGRVFRLWSQESEDSFCASHCVSSLTSCPFPSPHTSVFGTETPHVLAAFSS